MIALSRLGSIALVALSWPALALAEGEPVPLSDPGNSGGWVLNPEVSDEFNAGELDRDKWIVQGDNGRYITWEGRAPSQFAAHNVFVEDGILHLRSQWEPDFDFVDAERAGARYGDPIAPVTAAAIISRHRFLYGYMEARTRASNSNMTSSFWTIGHESELDIYEQMGNPKNQNGNIRRDTLNSAIHDWRPGRYTAEFGQNKVFNNRHQLDFNVADDFHVYGAEWGPDFIRIFVDGELVREATREEIGDGWVLTNPMELWFDTEIFHWLGYPHAEELPADYEIDYVRVWQKPDPELLDRAFFGFEGPMIFPEEERRYLGDPPGRSKFTQDWFFQGPARQHFEIVENEQSLSGKRALRFTRNGELPGERLVAFAPFGSIRAEKGDYLLSMRVLVPADAGPVHLRLLLEDPWYESPVIDLSRFPRGEWTNLSIPVSRSSDSGERDRLRIGVENDGGSAAGTYYFDDFSLTPAP